MIYGDTDSVMIHSATDNLAEARKMAHALKGEINKHYRCMEIDIDGVMQSMLLLKKKKCACRARLPPLPPLPHRPRTPT